MRSRAPWGQMVVATLLVMVLPAVIVGALSALGVITAVWAAVLLAVVLSLAFTSAGSAYWRRHATGDVLFSDLLLWGWLRRRRMERRLGRADDLLERAGDADAEGKAALLRELGAALDAQDPYLDGHSRRVARYAVMTAARMDLPHEQAERVQTAAMIHDIGKLHIPPEIVSKAGALTDDEFERMKQHAAESGAMVECLGDPALAAAVRSHHERWDGSGYPDGLAGAQIPLEARIISVVDTFDAITSARAYRPATPHAKALKILDEEAGQQLDPDAARAFISCYSDRRGAALWAGIAAVPRQVAERLAITPGEITGVLAAAVTTPLVVVAGAMATEALPGTSGSTNDPPARSQQVASTSGATATPGVQPIPSPSASAPRAAGTVGAAPAQGGVAGVQATSTPASGGGSQGSPDPAQSPSAPGAASALQKLPTSTPADGASEPAAASLPETRGAPTPGPKAPGFLPPFPTATSEPPPEPIASASPTATAMPLPTASPEPSPEPGPTPEPLPPLLPSQLPVFPEATPPPPTHSKDDCKNGGWMELGYPNQGQCIADADRA